DEGEADLVMLADDDALDVGDDLLARFLDLGHADLRSPYRWTNRRAEMSGPAGCRMVRRGIESGSDQRLRDARVARRDLRKCIRESVGRGPGLVSPVRGPRDRPATLGPNDPAGPALPARGKSTSYRS